MLPRPNFLLIVSFCAQFYVVFFKIYPDYPYASNILYIFTLTSSIPATITKTVPSNPYHQFALDVENQKFHGKILHGYQ